MPDAADVVAVMLIAHGSVVRTAVDQTQADPRDAADVGDGVLILGRDEIDADDVMDIQRLDVDRPVADLGIDLGAAAAVNDRSVAVSGDTAGEVFAVDAARRAAVADHAQILTDDAADGDQAFHRPGEAAAGQTAAARADDTAHAAAAAVGHDRAGDIQIEDAPFLLKIAEQPLMRAVGGAVEVLDRMPVAAEGAGERGNGHDGAACKVDIGLKLHAQPDRPDAAAAVPRKGLKFLGRGDTDRLSLVFAGGSVHIADDELPARVGRALLRVGRIVLRPIREDRGGEDGKQHTERTERGKENGKRMLFILHGSAPPFPAWGSPPGPRSP